LTRFLRQKYQGRKVDLVIPIAFPALRFFQQHRAELFPGVPAIFCAANLDAIRGLDPGPDITGVRLPPEWGATIEAPLKVDPGVRPVIVITGTSVIDRDLEAAAAGDPGRYRKRGALTYLAGLPMAQLLDAVACLPIDADVAAGQVADATVHAIVPPALDPPAGPAGRFFDRRMSVRIRACGSPNTPVTIGLGRNPGKRYASHSRRGRRGVGMRRSCPILAQPPQCFRPLPERGSAPSAPGFSPLTSTESRRNKL
jgi:hypothetical protein